MTYYKEEELYNGAKGVFQEKYNYIWLGKCCRVGLCVNSSTIFCRADNNCTDGHEYLSQTNSRSSWLNKLDTICPKVAYGITAWLLYSTIIDTKGRLRFPDKQNPTKQTAFANYKRECIARYEYANKDDYNYYRENGDTANAKRLDKAFHAIHIEQEREYISKFSRHECMGEEHYKAILQCANEYIKWVEDNYTNKPTPTTKSVVSKPTNNTYAYTPTKKIRIGHRYGHS